jgi:hypothetical protein
MATSLHTPTHQRATAMAGTEPQNVLAGLEQDGRDSGNRRRAHIGLRCEFVPLPDEPVCLHPHMACPHARPFYRGSDRARPGGRRSRGTAPLLLADRAQCRTPRHAPAHPGRGSAMQAWLDAPHHKPVRAWPARRRSAATVRRGTVPFTSTREAGCACNSTGVHISRSMRTVGATSCDLCTALSACCGSPHAHARPIPIEPREP